MGNSIGFGKFNAVIPSNKAYRNIRVLETALKLEGSHVKIKHIPVDNWNHFQVEIDHANLGYEKKLQKALKILTQECNNTNSALYKVSKLLGISKTSLAESANKINRTIHHKKPITYHIIPKSYHA